MMFGRLRINSFDKIMKLGNVLMSAYCILYASKLSKVSYSLILSLSTQVYG